MGDGREGGREGGGREAEVLNLLRPKTYTENPYLNSIDKVRDYGSMV